MPQLLVAAERLLVEILEGLDVADANPPELRVGTAGRRGSRFWLIGTKRKAFPERRPAALFDELRSARLLRKLRTDSSGTYYAVTRDAFAYRDRLQRPATSAPLQRARPDEPPPELTGAESRLVTLRSLAASAEDRLVTLAEASTITEFQNDPNSGIFYVPIHPWTWDPLDPAAVPTLGAARDASHRWSETGRLTISIAAPEHLEEFDEHIETCQRVLVRSKGAAGPPASTPAGVVTAVESAIARQVALMEGLPGAVEPSETMVVPDTNALLQDPNLEEWVLGNGPVAITIVPQVITELDEKKAHGNEGVARKATSLIQRFKEYGRRGDTFDGVKLAGPRLFRERALTPDMGLMPDSLDASHADDRILAASLHLASTHLSSRVVLVTRDRNLQNKARFAKLPAVDVADL